MIVDDLKDLSQIWNLASLDGGGSTFISLKAFQRDGNESRMSTRFVGIHMSVERTIACNNPAPMDIVIDGKTFRDSLGLFPAQAEVILAVNNTQMTMKAGGAKTSLVLTEKGGEMAGDKPTNEVVVKVSRELLLTHAKALASLVGRKMTQLILTGINMQISEKGLILRACDGSSAVAIVAIPVATQLPVIDGPEAIPAITITPLAVDLVGAIELLVDDNIDLGFSPRKLHIRDSRNDIFLSGLAGEYPKLDKLPRKLPNQVELNGSAVQSACRAANLFDVNKVIHMEVAGGKVALSTQESESGSFIVTNDGEGADLSIDLDAELLGNVISNNCQMHYDHGRALVMLHSQDRYTWLSPVIRH